MRKLFLKIIIINALWLLLIFSYCVYADINVFWLHALLCML